MNDEQLIWEAYTTREQLSDDIFKKKIPVELTKEEFLDLLFQEGELDSIEQAQKVLEYWEGTNNIILYNTPKPKDMSVIVKTIQGKYILDQNNYFTYLSNSMITNALLSYPDYKSKKERHEKSMREFHEKESKYPQLFKYLDYDEFDPDDIHPQILYHAGPKTLKVNDIEFDRGAMGFHLGTEQQMEYISKGIFKRDAGLSNRQIQRGQRLKISKYLVSPMANNKYIPRIETDMPWEDPVQLSVYLYYVGLLPRQEVESALDVFGYVDNRDEYNDDDLGNILFTVLDKVDRFGFYSENYHPSDDLPVVHPNNEHFKDPQALGFIRNLLVEQGFAGIIYENVGEGMHVSSEHENQYSLCVLDKCILKDA